MAYWSKSIALGETFRHAMRRYVNDVKNHGLLKKYWGLWGPIQCATFGVVPEHWRIPFIASISFFWVIILSCLSSRSKSPIKNNAADDVAASMQSSQLGDMTTHSISDCVAAN
jgi:protein Mpv17